MRNDWKTNALEMFRSVVESVWTAEHIYVSPAQGQGSFEASVTSVALVANLHTSVNHNWLHGSCT